MLFFRLQYLLVCAYFYKISWCQETKINPSENDIEDTTVVDTNKTAETTKTSPAGIEKTTPRINEGKSLKLVCPGRDVRVPFFSLPCKSTKECLILGKGLLCCNSRCLKGVQPPKPEPIHSPVLFGLVERVCSTEPLAELLEVKECDTDDECTPRICCQEKMLDGEVKGFCRIAQPKLDRLPRAKMFFQPLRALMGYMQCTPPPPPFLDVFPKPCKSPLDCFPNLCCQERGKKFCRPPKRSLLALVATVGQRFIPESAAKDFITRIS